MPDKSARAIQRQKRKELRNKNKEKAIKITEELMSQLIAKMKNCGFNKLTLSGYSGVCPATIGKIMQYHKIDNVTLAAVIGMARATGYKLELVRLSPEEDEYYEDRWIRLSDVDKLKE
ncbi:hypothetical protein J7L01_04980 [bacterium]|nr:hypothetical protein [bacterium]